MHIVLRVRWESLLPFVLLVVGPFQVDLRVENELYLRSHPEVSALVSSFVDSVISTKPDDIPAFAAEFFASPSLASKIVSK